MAERFEYVAAVEGKIFTDNLVCQPLDDKNRTFDLDNV